jgi:hypothetical protein
MREPVKTSHESILEYWCSRIDESDMGCDWDEALTRCWRCGDEHRTKSLHRCHIIPAQDGGKDEPSNLVLLCSPCHAEAPSLSDDKDAIWQWIKRTCKSYYGQFWGDRLFEEFEKLYGRPVDFKNVSLEKLVEESHKIGMHMGNACKHFSRASIAVALKKAGG